MKWFVIMICVILVNSMLGNGDAIDLSKETRSYLWCNFRCKVICTKCGGAFWRCDQLGRKMH